MSHVWLRRDLIQSPDHRHPRRVKLIDAVAGRVTRLARQDLLRLPQQTPNPQALDKRNADPPSPLGDNAAVPLRDDLLVDDAWQRGLLNRRPAAEQLSGWQYWLHWPQRLLCLRLPLLSADPLAVRLARHSDLLFHRWAIVFWCLAMLIAGGSMLCGWDRAGLAVGQMQLWQQQSAGGWVALATIFVVTKLIHELAHAVACRRAGVACGECGVLLLAGMPSPYCDVSLVSRLDSPSSRIGVMLAGIYVEWILATLAVAIWWVAPIGNLWVAPIENGWVAPIGNGALTAGGTLAAVSMNVMIVCGISTLLFNLNPLMRLDGYYVLSDLLGMANLRGQAALAWRGTVISRLGGGARGRGAAAGRSDAGAGGGSLGHGSLPLTPRHLTLAAYHVAATLFRLLVISGIIWMVLAASEALQLRPLGIAVAVMLVLPLLIAASGSVLAVAGGDGHWRHASWLRRGLLLSAGGAVLWAILTLPLSREIVVSGRLDVSDPQSVYAVADGWVVDTSLNYDAAVATGQPLWQLDNPQLTLDAAVWDSRRRLAELQSAAVRRSALTDDSSDVAWELDAANRRLVDSQWQAIQQRQQRLRLHASSSGRLLPPLGGGWMSAGDHALAVVPPIAATGWQGRYAATGQQLGRIADPDLLTAHLVVPAQHRRLLRRGQPVRLIVDRGSADAAPWVTDTVIDAISEIDSPSEPTHARSHSRSPAALAAVAPGSAIPTAADRFEVRCALADPVDAGGNSTGDRQESLLGVMVEARIGIGQETVGQRLLRWLQEALDERI